MKTPGSERSSIDAWLFEFDEQEQQLKDDYLKNGKLFSKEAKAIHEKHPVASPQRQVLTESMFIDKHNDVAIVKHPRYIPRFDHSHTFFEVSYLVDGSCNHTVHTYGTEESVTLQKGDVFILPPSIVHNILTDGDSVVVNILMRRSTFDSAFLRGIPATSVLSNFFTDILYSNTYPNFLLFHTEDNALIHNTFYSILQEYRCGKIFTPEIINQLLGLFFLYLLRECGDRVQISKEYHKEARFIPAIIHYLELHYADTTIGNMAKHFGYDISHLCRLYKNQTGTTLRETLCQIRMRHSSDLLLKSNRSVDDIASMVGYQDVSSFIRRFRRQFGVTPLQYRKEPPDVYRQPT